MDNIITDENFIHSNTDANESQVEINEYTEETTEFPTDVTMNSTMESIISDSPTIEDKMRIVAIYKNALLTAINNLKDDISAAGELKKEEEAFSSYYSTKKILNELQRKINKQIDFTENEFKLLAVVCQLNAERMSNYANTILEHTKTVTLLAKSFIS